MANEKFLKGRFQQKTDIENNWKKAKNFIPLNGEIIVYSDLNKIKIGDGSTNVNDLPFVTTEITTGEGEDSVVIGSGEATGKGAIAIGSGTAAGDYSISEGTETVAGCNGYYIAAIDPANHHIYLHTKEEAVIPTWDNPSSFYNPTFNSNYKLYLGDVNGDGILDDKDVELINEAVANNNLENLQEEVADVDKDGTISANDALIISKYIKGEQVDFEFVPYGNEFSISSDSYYHWPFAGQIIEISGNRITYGKNNALDNTKKWQSNVNNGAKPMVFFIPIQSKIGLTNVGTGAHAEGWYTHAAGQHSHTEGYNSIVAGRYGHAEGNGTRAGYAAHAEGIDTLAYGLHSHAEGNITKTLGDNSHAEGRLTNASGAHSHAEGLKSIATGIAAHAEGNGSEATEPGAHAEGNKSKAYGKYSHAEGSSTEALGESSHAEGVNAKATGAAAHAEGKFTNASEYCSHAEGNTTTASGKYSHAEGSGTVSSGQYSHAEGIGSQATNTAAHAEGNKSKASGAASHAEGNNSQATGAASHAEGSNSQATGAVSHAEGSNSQATGAASHAEGNNSQATGAASHAEGAYSTASGKYSHAEGFGTITSDQPKNNGQHVQGRFNVLDETSTGYAHIVGGGINNANRKNIHTLDWNGNAWISGSFRIGGTSYDNGKDVMLAENAIGKKTTDGGEIFNNYVNNTASGQYSHAEGCITVASGQYSHAEGRETKASGESSHSEGQLTKAKGITAHAECRETEASGNYSHAEGYITKATGTAAHAEGNHSQATSSATHAEGYYTIAKDKLAAHAEGDRTQATNSAAHAEGYKSIASGQYSHAEGGSTKAQGQYSHAGGYYSVAHGYASTAIGSYNIISEQDSKTVYSQQSKAFIIGNGTSDNRSNCFSVDFSGNVIYNNTANATGADYAEYFEWSDSNPNAEDRIGRFVTLSNNNKIALANIGDEILGIISGHAAILGDAYEDSWNGMYDRDIYGRLQYEEVEVERLVDTDEEGNPIYEIVTETNIKLNPNYDPTQAYIPRSARPEWAPVGLLGKLVVIDDGSCVPGQKCSCGINGTATASETGYHVLKRLDDTHIQILLK